MIGPATLLAAQATQPYMAKPLFGFACQPKDANVAAPAFEYRIFLPDPKIPVSGPAKIDISKLKGLPGAPDHLTLEGTLDRIQAMPSPDGSSDLRLARIKATNVIGGHSYILDMWFGVKFAHSPDGQATFAGVVPSSGTLRSDVEGAPAVPLTCPDLTGRAAKTERGK